MPDATTLLLGGALIAIYLILCAALVRRRNTGLLWCLPLAILVGGTYAVHASRMTTVYHSLASDQAFMAAFTNNVIHGNWLGDYFDKEVVCHYPPLFFWVSGLVARATGMTAIEVTRALPMAALATLPFCVFLSAEYVTRQKGTGIYASLAFLGLGAYRANWFLGTERSWGTIQACIHRPYELFGAVGALVWLVWMVRVLRSGRHSFLTAACQGLMGGVILLLYYPWYLIATVALAIAAVAFVGVERVRARIAHLLHISFVTLVSLLVASPWLVPLVQALLAGTRDPNYGAMYLPNGHLDPTLVTMSLGYAGSLFVLGVAGLQLIRERTCRRALLVLAVLLYGWWGSVLLTYPLLRVSFLPGKASAMMMPFYAILASVALARLRDVVPRRLSWLTSPGGLLVMCLPLLPTVFTWNSATDRALKKSLAAEQATAATQILRALPKLGRLTLLGTVTPVEQLPAHAYWVRLYLSPNIHYSNPLAKYSERAERVRQMRCLTDTRHMHAWVAELGIDALVLEKLGDKQLGVRVAKDARRYGTYETVTIPRTAFQPPFFREAYEGEDLVLFTVERGTKPCP